MLLKWLLFLVALTAHFYLWGEWSLSGSTNQDTLLILGATLLVIAYLAVPIRVLFKKENPVAVFHKWWMQAILYLYVILIIVISLMHFTGIIKILLPIKITLLISYSYLKYRLKQTFKKPS